ncbi:MAG: hypothetical protein J0G33_05335 [Afipia felis]|nr:hypothetical protein [Afipia felis]
MKISVIFVAVSLAAAILVLASLLILTRTDTDTKIFGTAFTAPKFHLYQPLWKMKNAPTAIKAKPTA